MQFIFTLLLMCCQTTLRLAEWCSLSFYDRKRRLPPVAGVLFLTTLDFRTVRTWFLFLINWTASSFLLQQQKRSKTTGQVWIDWGPGTITPLPITPYAPWALTRFQGDWRRSHKPDYTAQKKPTVHQQGSLAEQSEAGGCWTGFGAAKSKPCESWGRGIPGGRTVMASYTDGQTKGGAEMKDGDKAATVLKIANSLLLQWTQ